MDLPPAPTPPAASGAVPSNADRTANLLNLLKFSNAGGPASLQSQPPPQQPQSQSQPQPPPPPPPPELQQEHHRSSFGHGQQYAPTRIHQPAPAGADPTGLLAALMRGSHEPDEPRPQPRHQPASTFSAASPSSDTRAYLLNLLNRPKPSQTDQPLLAETSRSNGPTPQSPEAAGDAARYFGHYQQPPNAYQAAQQFPPQAQHHPPSESFSDVQHPASNVSSFSFPPTQESATDMSALYQQLMGSLQKSSPRDHSAHGSSGPPSFHVPNKDQPSPAASGRVEQPRPGSERSAVASPSEHGRRVVDRSSSLHSHQSMQQPVVKQTPPTSELDGFSPVDNNKEAVADVVAADSPVKPDVDAPHVLARPAERDAAPPAAAEHPVPTQADAPRDGQEWTDESDAAAQTVEEQVNHVHDDLDEPPSQGSPSTSYAHEPAPASGDNAQAVADSWESADQESAEEKEHTPVRVYNFPMKPWISITLQEGRTEPRPLFRDESIMDIARLKKDFDQIDRNLYTASQTYMTYGMSKQGGLRVIRQDDGKDAKVFTDTRDRIFNVAMLVTPPDGEGVHREAIIGTGVSGTVYWVQIKDGEKDHIEDTHLEQYGFALPSMVSQEGDALNGVIKTRARASTAHPEYFAVGRGKTITFIWPSYIMHNSLFKAGHDRVVDTDRLLRQCSLRIHTGKASKDFTFSQDDTVLVSLDNTGRIKFWDVRDLTAVKEGSDGRAPMPAHTSMELKEPLLTLASTPEGEKAWPTSVMLVDKQRPFVRGGALRYMLVGMRQNHTLQLWDLALGKPVQEFNLPHSNDTDAVCSVMYHPASGMIVIGHPTRNSIYFAHLSAPKYTLKGVSQAEYMQRIVAQDATMPQPDSTAVISGVREYSFANRGIIRSLDILGNPAMVQDADEPTLFELYAMHSKGVTCLLVRQCELGWSKDNKVLDAVDAVQEDVVTVSKLKAPQQPAEADLGPARRAAGKEPTLQSTPPPPSDAAAVRLSASAMAAAKFEAEAKEMEETPAQSSKETASERPERKPRKKKGKEPEAAANGTANAPRAGPSGVKPSPEPAAMASSGGTAAKGVSAEMLDSAMGGLEARLTAAMAATLRSSLGDLRGKMDEGARARDESFNQHQLKLLDMVSEVLNENTQKVLESLIHHQFTELVIPAIGDHAGRAVKDFLQHTLQPSVGASIQREIQGALPRSLRSTDFVNAVSDRVGAAVTSSMQQDVLATLTQSLTVTMSKLATQSAQRVALELDQKHQGEMERIKAQRAADAGKMDQLLTHVGRLTDMVSSVAASQSSLQADLAKLKQPVHELPVVPGVAGSVVGPGSGVGSGVGSGIGSGGGVGYGNMGRPAYGSSIMGGSNAPSQHGSFAASQAAQPGYMASPHYARGPQPAAAAAASSEHTGLSSGVGSLAGAFAGAMSASEAEADYQLVQRMQRIEKMIQEGRLQDAVVQWIQSGYEQDIFRRCLSGYPPSTFEGLPPLLLLVVIATISKELKPNQLLKHEVDWIEMAVRAFADNLPRYDWEGHDWAKAMKSASQTLHLLVSRLKPLIASYSDGFPLDPFLAKVDKGKMEWVVRSSEHILASLRDPHGYD